MMILPLELRCLGAVKQSAAPLNLTISENPDTVLRFSGKRRKKSIKKSQTSLKIQE